MLNEILIRNYYRVKPYIPRGTQIFLRRCVADGVRGLARHGAPGGLPIRTPDDVDDLRDRLQPGAVGILYWTTLCYGNTIPGFSIEGSNKSRVTVGARLLLLIVNVHAEYSIADTPMLGAGVGITFR